MNSISLLFLLALPPSLQQLPIKPPSPGTQDIPLRRAQEISQAFADKAGFKVKVGSLPSQFVVGHPSNKNGYPVEDERRWYLGGPEIHFTVGARRGRLTTFRRGNRMDSSHGLSAIGPHMSTRNALQEHAKQVARRLGVFKPVRIHVGGIWDDEGRPRLRGSTYVILLGKRRQLQMNFHPKDGDLMFYNDFADAPNISPRDALEPGPGEISGKAAVQALSKFCRALKLSQIEYGDSFATLHTRQPVRGQNRWHIDHPNYIAEVDAKGAKVVSMRPLSEERSFRKGDRPFVSSKAQAERHLRSIVSRVGVPASAKAAVRITNELVSRIGWVGQIKGTFTWGNNTCNVVCDLRRGELLNIDFLKPGKAAKDGAPLSPG
jgi:hypothetical protein